MSLRTCNGGSTIGSGYRGPRSLSASSLGTVGIDWQVAGFGPVSGAGHCDMVLRNITSGAFQAYDIANNQITATGSLGGVGSDWQVVGIAANAPAPAMGASDSSIMRIDWCSSRCCRT